MNDQDRALICRRVASAILFALEDDLNGGELLMKEVWEACETDEEIEIAKQEIARIIEAIRHRPDDKRSQG